MFLPANREFRPTVHFQLSSWRALTVRCISTCDPDSKLNVSHAGINALSGGAVNCQEADDESECAIDGAGDVPVLVIEVGDAASWMF